MKFYTTDIKIIVEDYFSLPRGSVDLKKRDRNIKEPRQLVHYILLQNVKKNIYEFKKSEARTHINEDWFISAYDIGQQVGKVKHETVLHSYKVIADLIETDKTMAADYENIMKQIAIKYNKIIVITKRDIRKAIYKALRENREAKQKELEKYRNIVNSLKKNLQCQPL